MTELEKLEAGLEYDFWDAGVNDRKLGAIKFCRELRKLQDADATEVQQDGMYVYVPDLCATMGKIFM